MRWNAIARKICSLVAEPVWFEETELRVTASVGVVFHDGGQAATPAAMLAAADSALYGAKQAGRNQFQVVAYA